MTAENKEVKNPNFIKKLKYVAASFVFPNIELISLTFKRPINADKIENINGLYNNLNIFTNLT